MESFNDRKIGRKQSDQPKIKPIDAIEFRHFSWLNEKNLTRTFDFLKNNKLIFVCVDEPQGFKSSVPPVAEATSDIGFIRFHGRNRKSWDKPSGAASGRFNYLYSENELHEWVPRIKYLSEKTMHLHVVFNNCFDVKPITSARKMGQIIDQLTPLINEPAG